MRGKKLLGVAIVAFLLMGTAILAAKSFSSNYAGRYQKSIYDDDSKIINEANSYSYDKRIGDSSNGDLKLEVVFTGMETVYDLPVEEKETLNIDYDIDISSGRFKVVLVDSDNNVTTLIEGSKEGSQKIVLNEGENKIKIVGDDARGKIEISLKDEDEVIAPISK